MLSNVILYGFSENDKGFFQNSLLNKHRWCICNWTLFGRKFTGTSDKQGPSRDQLKILEKASSGAALAYLMAVAKRSNRTKFRDQVINPLVEEGWLEMTDPDSPRSPQQKYRLTEQGKALLEEMGKGKK